MENCIFIDNLAIEVTRRCNMNCMHCMRGEAQNKDISHETIDKILRNVTGIGCVTFTGGEVSLNVDAIEYTLRVCKENDIQVNSFYMVTNGKTVPDSFLLACVKWYSYIVECGGEDEYSGLALSKDDFHEPISMENEAKLKAFSFYRNDKVTDFTKYGVINLGRARNLVGYKKNDKRYLDCVDISCNRKGEYSINDDIIAVTVDGDVLLECDYEYSDIDDIKIGNVDDSNWFVKYYGSQNETTQMSNAKAC